MATVFIKPKDQLKVRTPAGDYLPEDGAEIELTSYWRRRLRDGDVTSSKPPRKSTKGAE